MVLFASQAALVIANARRYREKQRAKADLDALIDTSPVGVVVFDATTGAPIWINRETRRILKALRMPGRSLEQLGDVITVRRAGGREMSLDEPALAQVLSTGETVLAEEIVIGVPDGRSVTTLINATPTFSREGDVESVIVTIQDMRPLEELERLRSEFVGLVSHELRAPLTSIKGSTTTLLNESTTLDPAEMRQLLRIIDAQADRMRDLIRDLLDVAHIQSGTLSMTPVPVEVVRLVDEARNTFLSGGGSDNIELDLDPHLPSVIADQRRIVQVLNNLLTNAAQHSPDAAPVVVRAAHDGIHIAISVEDQGNGIAAECLPHLFRKFSRAEVGEEETHEFGGTGLGLAICRGIVETHGGRIWAESDGLGQGSRFTFTIPVAAEAPEDADDKSAAPHAHVAPESEARPRVLVVDDDPQTLRQVRDILTNAHYAPVVTAEPTEALSLIATHQPQLALLDLMLPGTDGIELMAKILSVADLPVIFLSGYGRGEIIARALQQGASDYVVKPFSPTELVARIGVALRKRPAPGWTEPARSFLLGDLSINYAERAVSVAGTPLRLTASEYELLRELSLNSGRALTYDHLLQQVWGIQDADDSRPLRTLVKRLRRKLGDDANHPSYIFTEPRVGYRMAEPEARGRATPRA